MAHRDEIIAYLNDFLRIGDSGDYCPHGLQVEGQEDVRRIALGVTAEMPFFEAALKSGSELLVVHHGFFWDGEPRTLIGNRRRRIQFLLENRLSLAGYHLPLDRHLEVGNNAQIARRLGCVDLEPFAEARGASLGVQARFPEPISKDELLARCRKNLVPEKAFIDQGPEEISTVAIISGSAARMMSLVVDSGLDLFITGEMDFTAPSYCKETGIHYLALGHHDSERWGPMALGPILEEKFEVETVFLNIENAY